MVFQALSSKHCQNNIQLDSGKSLNNDAIIKAIFSLFCRAHQYFEMAAQLNHTKALEYVAFSYLIGDYLTQNIPKAQEIFKDLAARGSPRGQLVCWNKEIQMYF